jgi:hypothetical protein
MSEYISLFPITIHILILAFFIINQNNYILLYERIFTNYLSPVNWQIIPASLYHRLLFYYENLGFVALFIVSIFLSINIKWYFGIFFLLEAVLISSILYGIIKLILFSVSDTAFLYFRMTIHRTRLVTIFVDMYMFYFIYKIISSN